MVRLRSRGEPCISLKEPISLYEKFLLHGKLEQSGDRMVKENIQQTEMMEDTKNHKILGCKLRRFHTFFPLCFLPATTQK